ncbi:hypothetical protein GDO78_014159 [Eleutherodactylus coqui]|uniref:Uncharacterized protein n=1 Tax=Eleutherodactylus coqui TaxID=57060 RepID=A0A8J6EM87_ELECQ|nr:hypothetical protein GDO78_014159 [Eleutherodactylus coqui]
MQYGRKKLAHASKTHATRSYACRENAAVLWTKIASACVKEHGLSKLLSLHLWGFILVIELMDSKRLPWPEGQFKARGTQKQKLSVAILLLNLAP